MRGFFSHEGSLVEGQVAQRGTVSTLGSFKTAGSSLEQPGVTSELALV